MFRIRKEQMATFETAALCDFEDNTVEHMKSFAPKHSEVIGESCVRQVIQLGLARAGQYGFTNCGPVRFYIELMFMFGSDFDTDPLLPWAGDALRAGEDSDQMTLAMSLHASMMDYIARVVGNDRGPSIRALRRVYDVSSQPIPSASGSGFEEAVLALMEHAFPERYRYLGKQPLRSLIRRAPESAGRLGLSTDRGVALIILLSYAIGHGFGSDPLFPWISAVLQDPRIQTPTERAERLERRAIIYLESALSYLEREHAGV
ncbi:hypothetical protein WMF30_15235 [Sorangium sp. So ce134]